ncbi:MAG TPA: arginase family protein [Acidimicrobiales bacterium]|nr:arginase family protein [Acidimicrobiales bacterium]
MPGCAKAPEALREAGLYRKLAHSFDAGVVLPERYLDDGDPLSGKVRNQSGLVEHATRLADRLEVSLNEGEWPLVLGGDCSLLVGIGLALSRRGRYGLVHIDGHTDFRHPGNSEVCLSVAGEDLAAVVGLHWPAISDIEGRSPYFQPEHATHVGCRNYDEYLNEANGLLGRVITATQVREQGVAWAARQIDEVMKLNELQGYWVHLDVDVLDPLWMPAVDSPDNGGLNPDELTALLRALVPTSLGADVTVFDPDLDPKGVYAELLTEILTKGFAQV